MPTPPRRWPSEVEREREEALQAATEAIQQLQTAQQLLDTARSKLQGNQSLATVLLADSDRMAADALTRLERILRCMSLARARPLSGRWPQVATKQRDDIEESAGTGVVLVTQALDGLGRARSKIQTNPGLSEAIVADVASNQARALAQSERIARLLTEAGLGRD